MKARRQREPGFSKELLQLSYSPYHIQKSIFHFPTKLNLSLFWHINEGIEEIMADYVHQEIGSWSI